MATTTKIEWADHTFNGSWRRGVPEPGEPISPVGEPVVVEYADPVEAELRVVGDEEAREQTNAVLWPAAEVFEQRASKIASLEAELVECKKQLCEVNPEQDYVLECNEVLAAKDKRIAELERECAMLRGQHIA